MLQVSPILMNMTIRPTYNANLPPITIREGNYLLRFARHRAELDELLKLRFEVFNLELGEGLDSSYRTGLDEDEFDELFHHLMVIDCLSNEIVGTYRMQTNEMAATGLGFYSAAEFDLSYLPFDIRQSAVEIGRACVARGHRNTQVLFLLLKGLIAYLLHYRKRYLFGCGSLNSQNPADGKAVMDLFKKQGHIHPYLYVPPREEVACYSKDFVNSQSPQSSRIEIPKLLRSYLGYGAKICGPPAIDQLFKTIDFFVLFDFYQMDSQTRRFFVGV